MVNQRQRHTRRVVRVGPGEVAKHEVAEFRHVRGDAAHLREAPRGAGAKVELVDGLRQHPWQGFCRCPPPVSSPHLRPHETVLALVFCPLLVEKKLLRCPHTAAS